MSKKSIIATIKLSRGRVGLYDPLSRIHLTMANPIAHIHAGTNCAQLRRNVRAGVIQLLEGSLGEDVPPFRVVNVDGQYKLASNAAAEMKPVYDDNEEDDQAVSEEIKKIQDEAEAKVKAELAAKAAEVKGVEEKDGGDVKDAEPEEIEKDEEKDAPEIEKTQEESVKADASKKNSKKNSKKK